MIARAEASGQSSKGNPHGVLDLWRASAVLDLLAGPESRGNYNAWSAHAHQSQVQLADLRVREVRTVPADSHRPALSAPCMRAGVDAPGLG